MRSVRFVFCGEGLLAAVSDLVAAFGIFVVLVVCALLGIAEISGRLRCADEGLEDWKAS